MDESAIPKPVKPVKARKKISHKEYLSFRIEGFESLPEPNGNFVETDVQRAHGVQWKFRVYPRGSKKKNSDQVTVGLVSHSLTLLEVKCEIAFASKSTITDGFPKISLARQTVLDHLLQGALVINVEIQIFQDPVWYPSLRLENDGSSTRYKELLHSGQNSDATFVVAKRKFHVHRCILAAQAQGLFTLLIDGSSNEPVELFDVGDAAFEEILCFVYTGVVTTTNPIFQDESASKSLLIAADRFGITELKLYAESVIVDKFLNVSNAAENFLFGHSYSCALLKEAAMHVCCMRREEVQEFEGWNKVKESADLLLDLFNSMAVYSGGKRKSDQISVGSLRDKLVAKGLDADGPREVLVKRLRAGGSIDEVTTDN